MADDRDLQSESNHENKPQLSPSLDQMAAFNERLKYIESVAGHTVARLYEIETRLGLPHGVSPKAPQAPLPRPPAIATPRKPTLPAPPSSTTPQRESRIGKPFSPPPSPSAQTSVNASDAVRPSTPTSPSPQQRPAAKEPPPPPLSGTTGAQGFPSPRTLVPSFQTARPAYSTRQRSLPIQNPALSLETRIGGSWFNRIGVIAIVLGVGFLFKYAYDNSWIKPWGWVSIGVGLGLAFILGGEKTRTKYESYAYGLTGCGISLLYVSVFAAFKLWDLVPHPTAFAMMAAITALASLLSARYNALAIAVLGLLGGFLTPILLFTGQDNEAGLFGYVALLDLGVLALAYRKQWRGLNYLAFTGTIAMFAAWADAFYEPDKLGTTIVFLTVFFAIFALLAVTYNVINQRPTNWLDLGLVFVNAALYFSVSYMLLDERHHNILGAFAALVAVFYLSLGWATYARNRDDNLLIHTFLGLAFLFAVLAVPIQFDQHWVTMCWAIEGAVMTWVGLRTKDRISRYAGLVVFVIAASHWFLVDVYDFAFQSGGSFMPILNKRALSCAVLIASLAAASWLYNRYRDTADEQESSIFTSLYVLSANAAAILLLSMDANDYLKRSLEAGAWQNSGFAAWNDTRQFTLSALWTIYGTAALAVGIVRRQRVVRVIAGLLLAMATIKVFAIDLAYRNAEWHHTVINQTFASLMALAFGLGVAAWLYSRSSDLKEESSVVRPILVLAANICALVALTVEPINYFSLQIASSGSEATNNALALSESLQFTLTLIWTIYASCALILGFRKNSKPVRTGALLLLGFAAVKAVIVDTIYYNSTPHRLVLNQAFGALAAVVAALSLGSYLYSRFAETSETERGTIKPLLIAAANIVAVIALSFEPIGYFNTAIDNASAAAGQTEAISQLRDSMHFSLMLIWSVYASAATVIGFKRQSRLMRVGALSLLALGAFKLLVVDLWYYDADWHRLLLNQTFGAFLLLIAPVVLMAYLYAKTEVVEEKESILPLLIRTANVLAILAFTLEAIGFFNRAIHAARAAGESGVQIAHLESSMHFALTAVWVVYAAAAIVIGMLRRSRDLRFGALALITLALIKILVFDIDYYDAPWRRLIFNQTFGSFALLVAVISLAIFCLSRISQSESRNNQKIIPVLVTVANLLAIAALSLEAFGHFAAELKATGVSVSAQSDLAFAQQLSLSVIWTVYGGGLLLSGIWRRNRLLRIMALILLGLTTVKVFLIDLASLRQIYRIISFIVLGAILLAVSYLYQRYRQRTIDGNGSLAENL